MVTELYFSVDIEADGPVPSPYSMSSIGICLAGSKTEGGVYIPIDPLTHTWYSELKPISDEFIAEAAAVSGLSRDDLIQNGLTPHLAMKTIRMWISNLASDDKIPVYVAYPLSFDWVWTHWYFQTYCDQGDPFSFSNAIDIKTLFMAYSGNLLTQSTKRNMSKNLKSKRRHTHNALDDALGQADLFSNLMMADIENSRG